jgi:hypothetical protein
MVVGIVGSTWAVWMSANGAAILTEAVWGVGVLVYWWRDDWRGPRRRRRRRAGTALKPRKVLAWGMPARRPAFEAIRG